MQCHTGPPKPWPVADRVAGEAANALYGERIPGLAERIEDGIVGVEQAVGCSRAELHPVSLDTRLSEERPER